MKKRTNASPLTAGKLTPTAQHYECFARCMTCGLTWGAKTSHGTGYQHAAMHGHVVIIDAFTHIVYNGSEREKQPTLFTGSKDNDPLATRMD